MLCDAMVRYRTGNRVSSETHLWIEVGTTLSEPPPQYGKLSRSKGLHAIHTGNRAGGTRSSKGHLRESPLSLDWPNCSSIRRSKNAVRARAVCPHGNNWTRFMTQSHGSGDNQKLWGELHTCITGRRRGLKEQKHTARNSWWRNKGGGHREISQTGYRAETLIEQSTRAHELSWYSYTTQK